MYGCIFELIMVGNNFFVRHKYYFMDTQYSNSETGDAAITSGKNISAWLATLEEPIAYETLQENIDTDILVIGGGIAGLTTAYYLAKEGRKVVLIEDGFVGSGETGRTTAHITCALDDLYMEIEKLFDEKTAQLAANSHTAAIEWIANTVKLNNIDCDFKRVDGYLFLHPTDNKETLDDEYAATKRAGLLTEMHSTIPGIAAEEGQHCIKYPQQAQFHILKYLKGLAKAFTEHEGKIYTKTRAENISTKGATANGFEITAQHIVVATNTPINDWVTIHTKQWPYRTYVIAAKVPKNSLPFALWWDTGDNDSKWVSKPYHYVRLQPLDDDYDLLISGGEDHRTGQADTEGINEEDRYDRLITWTKKRFPMVNDIAYKWSGQVMEPVDALAYIGKNPGDENVYIITGDSGNGMTHGTLGGLIIKDIITGKENPWIEIYSPSRISIKATGSYLKEVGNMTAQYADWFKDGDVKNIHDLKPGEGGIVSHGFKKIAAYCDEENMLHTCTAVCPHLGAILQWNAEEKTFDCPMHGSRFTTEGVVMNGPAITDLKKILIVEEEKVMVNTKEKDYYI